MLKQMVLIAGLLASGIVLAEPDSRWTKISEGVNGEMYVSRVYTKIIDPKNKTIETWVKSVVTTDGKLFKKGDHLMSKQQFKCSTGQSKTLSMNWYNGKTVHESNKWNDAEWEDVMPETMNEQVMVKLCISTFDPTWK